MKTGRNAVVQKSSAKHTTPGPTGFPAILSQLSAAGSSTSAAASTAAAPPSRQQPQPPPPPRWRSVEDVEAEGAATLAAEDAAGTLRLPYRFLYARSDDLQVGDVPELLRGYKSLALQYEALARGAGVVLREASSSSGRRDVGFLAPPGGGDGETNAAAAAATAANDPSDGYARDVAPVVEAVGSHTADRAVAAAARTTAAATPAPAAPPEEEETITVVTPLYTSEPSPAVPVESVVIGGAGVGGETASVDGEAAAAAVASGAGAGTGAGAGADVPVVELLGRVRRRSFGD